MEGAFIFQHRPTLLVQSAQKNGPAALFTFSDSLGYVVFLFHESLPSGNREKRFTFVSLLHYITENKNSPPGLGGC
jgi:hypothetical protein